jgi:copper oxidase (laccase) domain-containing protein
MQCCYEVGTDVAEQFDDRYSLPLGGGKWLFDNAGVVLDQLIAAGLQPERIEMEDRCTICDPRLHSWRRDREKSGRMLALIGLTES